MTVDDAIVALINEFHLGDMIYTVRETADMTHFTGNSWEHPRVQRFSAIVDVLTARANELARP